MIGINKLVPGIKSVGLCHSVQGTAEMLADDLNEGKGTLGKLLKDDTLYENMNQGVDNVNNLGNDVKENPGKYVKAYWKSK